MRWRIILGTASRWPSEVLLWHSGHYIDKRKNPPKWGHTCARWAPSCRPSNIPFKLLYTELAHKMCHLRCCKGGKITYQITFFLPNILPKLPLQASEITEKISHRLGGSILYSNFLFFRLLFVPTALLMKEAHSTAKGIISLCFSAIEFTTSFASVWWAELYGTKYSEISGWFSRKSKIIDFCRLLSQYLRSTRNTILKIS